MNGARRTSHALTLIFLGTSASLWAVISRDWFMPLLWLGMLILAEIWLAPHEGFRFLRRLILLAVTLGGVSLLHILFRRTGTVIVSVKGSPLIFSDGLREAGLLWIRFMILIVLARILAGLSVFRVLVLLSRWRVPVSFSLLLGMTFRMIPFLFAEARTGMWTLHFRGVCFRTLSLKKKISAVKQLAYGLLVRGVEYAHHSAAALELRGYGHPRRRGIEGRYPLNGTDYVMVILTLVLNGAGLFLI